MQEFSESFEQQLCFRTKCSVNLGPESRRETWKGMPEDGDEILQGVRKEGLREAYMAPQVEK